MSAIHEGAYSGALCCSIRRFRSDVLGCAVRGGWIAALARERFPSDTLPRLVSISRAAVIATGCVSRRARGSEESDCRGQPPTDAASECHLLNSRRSLRDVNDMTIGAHSDYDRVTLLSSALVGWWRKVQLTSEPLTRG